MWPFVCIANELKPYLSQEKTTIMQRDGQISLGRGRRVMQLLVLSTTGDTFQKNSKQVH